MPSILVVGIIIFLGFIFGSVCARFGLPKVTGYILAGVALNPDLTGIVTKNFLAHTTLITHVSLALITFSVGGSLLFSKVRALGKGIALIAVFESEGAFGCVFIGFMTLAPLLVSSCGGAAAACWLPLALLAASLASPTDPSATLAVEHECKAHGDVSTTILGVAALDDILGIVNYSFSITIVGMLLMGQPLKMEAISQPVLMIMGSMALGAVFGVSLNLITRLVKNESEGVIIVVIFSQLMLCFGLADLMHLENLLATMTMGVVVVNWNPKPKVIFPLLQRYTEELIFVLFFTISAMHLDFSVLADYYMLVILFVATRAAGKMLGAYAAAILSGSSPEVKKYTVGGLIPQGGIVIGLALLIKQNMPAEPVSDIIINVVIGATVIHEFIGPVITRWVLARAGEI